MLFAVFGWIALAGALCWPFLLYRIISKASKDRSAGVECFLLALFLSLIHIFRGLGNRRFSYAPPKKSRMRGSSSPIPPVNP